MKESFGENILYTLIAIGWLLFLGYLGVPLLSKMYEFTSDVVTTTYGNIFNENQSVTQNNKVDKTYNTIETLSCELTCLDGTTDLTKQLFNSCRLPPLNPIIVKLNNKERKVTYISTSDKYIDTRLFSNKIAFASGNIY